MVYQFFTLTIGFNMYRSYNHTQEVEMPKKAFDSARRNTQNAKF